MPRRRDVKHDELAKITKLRESNTSWLQIERDTGVPRQIAKRAYIERQLSLSREELKKAREAVAAEELRKHINYLVKLARSLLDVLDVSSFSDKRSANDVLHNLWQSDILGEWETELGHRQPTKREISRTTYHNLLLFRSLQDHSREKVDWEALPNWKAAWDACQVGRDKLKEEARDILSNILKQEKPSLTGNIVRESEKMLDGIVHAVWEYILARWQYILTDKLDQEVTSIRLSQTAKITVIIFTEARPMTELVFTDADPAKRVLNICIWAANNLRIVGTVKSLAEKVSIMKKAIKKLEEELDPLILRPMILNSPKCDLCPA